MLVIITASTLTGTIITPTQMENAWLTEQPRDIFPFCKTLKMLLASSLVAGTLKPFPTWFFQERIYFYFFYFYLYIYPPDSQESDGGATT